MSPPWVKMVDASVNEKEQDWRDRLNQAIGRTVCFDHLKWLVDTKVSLAASCGAPVTVLELQHQLDQGILSSWASHYRNHYCDDNLIDDLRSETGLTRQEYLETLKFPDRTTAPGPGIRSGDFAEILVADYLESVLGFWVPRTRYESKTIRNESTKGADIIGFKITKEGSQSPDDTLALFEAKAQLTGTKANGRLQAAVEGSAKDELRRGESLNAVKQRLLERGGGRVARVVGRFQNRVDHPYTDVYGAAAVSATELYDQNDVKLTNTIVHPHSAKLSLVVIHGSELMELVHALYVRAANEA